MEEMTRKIIVLCLIFFVATGAILFAVKINVDQYNIPDPPNYVTIIVEISVGFFIATLVYMITKKQQKDVEQREASKTLEAHQYYKERLFDEFITLVSRVDTALHMYLNGIQRENMLENINLAKINLQRLYQINSAYSIPPEITSKCDDVLAHYHSTMNVIERGKGMEHFMKTTKTFLVKKIKECLEEDFFSKNNNLKIEKNLARLEDQLSQILSKEK